MKLINCEQSDIDPIALYYLHLEFLKADEIAFAHQAAIEALEFKELDIKKRIDLLWFFVRYDNGYKFITSHCDSIVPFCTSRDLIYLFKFLNKLIELNYLIKLDLSTNLIAALLESKNE